MANGTIDSNSHRLFNLIAARRDGELKTPASHQHDALSRIDGWYKLRPSPHAGAILVLPTGGGKTFTAIRSLCTGPISRGYKVLWLAQTHHLLDQAFESFPDSLSLIAEPKEALSVRVVSGTPGHSPVSEIRTDDDVVIATLQTITNAYKSDSPAFNSFIEAADGKLFVLFDEAHHSPAPSYRNLILALRDRCAQMFLLGWTATPTYSDQRKQGWLLKLFPQGIIHQVTANELMAAQILAKPILQELRTDFTPDFDPREFEKWSGTFQDLPEHVVTQLAENRERNLFIAATYAKHKEKYGKTIIFADR